MTDKLLKFIKENLIFLIILSLIPVVYSNILHAPFVFDEQYLDLQENLGNLKILKIGFRHITNLSFALNDYSGWGLMGYHLFNILLHALNVILFYYLCHLTLNLPSQQARIGKLRFIPLIAATLFALHPIQTSAVTYIIQRATILATFFCLLSLVFYIWGSLSKDKWISLLFFYPASLVFLVFGLISKEQVVLFPFIIILYDLFFLSAFRWRVLALRLIPIVGVVFFIGSIAVVKLNALKTLKDILSMYLNINTPIPFKGWMAMDVFWTPWQHILTEFRIVCKYLTLIALPLPSRMVFDYGPGYPVSTGLLSPLTTILSISFVVTLVILSIKYAKKYTLLSFGILFYLLTISLESFFAVGLDLYFEHRNYLPSIGIFLALSSFITILLRKVSYKNILYVLLIVSISLSYLTYTRNNVWKSKESLWKDTLKKAPDNKRAMIHLGQSYMNRGDFKDAKGLFIKSLEIDIPKKTLDFIAYSNLLNLYSNIGERKEASDTLSLMEELSSDINMIDLSPDSIFYTLGNAYHTIRDYNKSEKYLKKGLFARGKGRHIFSKYILLGQIELHRERLEEAENYFEKARTLSTNSAIPYLHLGDIYMLKGDRKKAENNYRMAIKMNPAYYSAYIQLAQLYLASKAYSSASETMEKALNIRAGDPALYISLGSASYMEGNIDKAIHYFKMALKLNPNNPSAHFNLGQCYIKTGDKKNARKSFVKFLEIVPEKGYGQLKEKVRIWMEKMQDG